MEDLIRAQETAGYLDRQRKADERAFQIEKFAAREAYCLLSAIAHRADALAAAVSTQHGVHATYHIKHAHIAADVLEDACCVEWFRDQLRGALHEQFKEDSDSPHIKAAVELLEQSGYGNVVR
jgi:hypothetical protein